MTAILPNSVFLHIPKTGGVWVREVLSLHGLYLRNIRLQDPKYTTNTSGSWHNVPWDDKDFISRTNRFAFVRHPLTWYRSYWSFKVANNNWDSTDFDRNCADPFFTNFIDNVIRYYPNGFLTWMYGFYTPYCTYVGRQESLAADLTYILAKYEDIEISIFPEVLNNSPVSTLDQALYLPIQAKQILWLERKIIKDYDYN